MNTHNAPSHSAFSHLRRKALGFTLIELLVVLAIASILAGAAVPSLRDLIRSTKLTNSANDLFASLTLARSEAAKRHARVTLCKSADGNLCSTTGGWEQGWIVFHDPNDDGVRDPGEDIVSRVDSLPNDMRLSGNLNVAKYISYTPTGETKLASGAFQAGTVTLCNASSSSEDARQIVLNAVGRPRVQRVRVKSCL
jgi:type IV fimbrial biogenesis protein FimT